MDENIFEKPFEFRPERWMNDDNTLEKYLIPFSVGKRFCIGKHLTKDILFLFTIMILRRFNFNLSDEVKDTSEQDLRVFGLSRSLKPVDLKINLA
jgi:cytochrome P450